jgi:hypothetical protein
MSLYNEVCGMNAGLAIMFSPFLPIRADHFPRFRNIFSEAEDSPIPGSIFVYTRMGGGNRECWWGDEEKFDSDDDCSCFACQADRLEQRPQCAGSYDDEFDSTYRTFVFTVSEEDQPDFNALTQGRREDLSERYKARLAEMFAERCGPNTRAALALLGVPAPSEKTA